MQSDLSLRNSRERKVKMGLFCQVCVMLSPDLMSVFLFCYYNVFEIKFKIIAPQVELITLIVNMLDYCSQPQKILIH